MIGPRSTWITSLCDRPAVALPSTATSLSSGRIPARSAGPPGVTWVIRNSAPETSRLYRSRRSRLGRHAGRARSRAMRIAKNGRGPPVMPSNRTLSIWSSESAARVGDAALAAGDQPTHQSPRRGGRHRPASDSGNFPAVIVEDDLRSALRARGLGDRELIVEAGEACGSGEYRVFGSTPA